MSSDIFKSKGSGIKRLAAIGVVLFVVSAIIGSLSPEEVKKTLYGSLSEKVREIEQAISGSGVYGLLLLPLIIFGNNLMVSLIMLALFPTIAGPWLFIAFQGFATGAIIGYTGIDESIEQALSTISSCTLSPSDISILKAALLIPHGIFEIPGISVFMATSARLSFTLIDYVSWKKGKRAEKPIFTQTLRSLLPAILIGAALLLVAAFVESFITPLVGFITAIALCSK
ncbi:MAG: stage II sporulation protein M [Sulfolobales archaeon]